MSLDRDFPRYDELFYEFSPLFWSTFSSVYIYHYFSGVGDYFYRQNRHWQTCAFYDAKNSEEI